MKAPAVAALVLLAADGSGHVHANITSPAPDAARPPVEPAPPGPADFRPYTERVPSTPIAFDMVPVPAGTSLLGSPPREKGRGKDEGPAHEVAVRAFWMGAREVTWDEYGVFLRIGIQNTLKATGDDAPDALTYPTPPYEDETFGYGKDRQPAIALTHHAVMEYARWLSGKTGRTYRLPTEAEWEHACRTGAGPAAAGLPAKRLAEIAVFADNAGRRPNPVGSKKADALGLFDMLGNAAEWTLDQYDAGSYARARPGVFPVNLPGDRRYPHVVRGGGWRDRAPALRCAARRASEKRWSRQDPQSPQSIWWHTEATDVGFRLVRPVDEYAELRGVRSKMTPDSPY